MALQVVAGASMMCTFGAAPSTLIVLPQNKVLDGPPAANIMDNKPMVNIPPFGVCMSLANPTVAAATSAALGVLTPMPCIPVIPAPWAPGAVIALIANMPALNNTSKCMCAYGGVISVVNPGQTKMLIP
ncbi:MAG: DUF4280 domain-containing protein [Planctomycetes bacterium]|nr:DUF4280 domain-containing protein [Planctomycetota bacterium]